MNCDKCGKPSVYHSTLIVNGVSKTTNLCKDCAIKEGVFTTSASGLFDDMFAPFMDFLPFEKVADLTCPVCKTSLREFKSTHLLGCPNCYDTFRQEIANVIKRIAPNEIHKPDSITGGEASQSKESTKQEKINELRQSMAQAVKEERYEDAAKIKKQIAKLEAENE